jgi:hypothetical protein
MVARPVLATLAPCIPPSMPPSRKEIWFVRLFYLEIEILRHEYMDQLSQTF